MIARLLALIILMAGAGTAAGAEFGRLFFTPAQRAALDGFRKLNIQTAVVTEDDRDKDLVVPPPSDPERMSVNGVVRRSDGKNTAWINNRAVDAGRPGSVKVAPGKNDNRVKLTAPQSGRSFDLKVGQTVEILSGTIEEGYARRAVAKPAPEPADKPAATGATPPQAATPPSPRAPDAQEPDGRRRPAQAGNGPAK